MSTTPPLWRELVAQVNGRTHFGQAGVRDPDAPCEHFDPGTPTVSGRCDTDGHYMCNECTERSTCADCGKRLPYGCECVPEDAATTADAGLLESAQKAPAQV